MRPQNLAQIVKQRMQATGMTAFHLAKRTGMTRQTIGYFINEERNITSDKLAKILAALNLIVIATEEKE